MLHGEAIVAPDVMGVTKRFLSQARQRMRDVAKVEEQLSKREWNDDGKRVTEWDVKQELRDIMRGVTEKDPATKPVYFSRAKGKLMAGSSIKEALGEEMFKRAQFLVDRLNDPRRSATALEMAEIAADTRMVLRHLNFGAPVMTDGMVSDDTRFDDPGAIAALNDSLEAEMVARIGLATDEVIASVNSNLETMAEPAPPTGLRAVSNAMESAGYVPYDTIRKEYDKIDAKAAAFERRAAEAKAREDTDGERKALAQAGELRQRMLSLRYQQDLLVNYLENAPEDGDLTNPKTRELNRLKRAIRTARMTQLAAEREHAANLALFHNRSSRLRNFSDLANSGLSRDMLARLLPDINADQLHSLLSRSHEVHAALERLRNLPAELEYMLIGGHKPFSMRKGPREERWAPVGEMLSVSDNARTLLPVNAMGALWNETFLGEEFGSEAIPAGIEIDSVEAGPVRFTADGSLEEMSVNELADKINDAVASSTRLMGYELSMKGRGEEADSSRYADYRRNLTALARKAVGMMRREMIMGNGEVGSGELERGGFHSAPETNKEGEVEGRMREHVLEIAAAPERAETADGRSDWDASLANTFDRGFASDLLLSASGFIRAMHGKGVYDAALLRHAGGLTPAGLAQSILAPRFLRFLALTKGTELQRRIRESAPESLRPEIDRIYNKLEPEIENSRAFRSDRDNLHREAMRALYLMREGMIAADTLYRESIHEAARLSKRDFDPAKEGTADESRSPIDEEVVRDFQFEREQIRRQAQSRALLGNAPEQTQVANTLLRPVSAVESLRLLDDLEYERQKFILVGKALENNEKAEWDDIRMILEGQDRRNKDDAAQMSDAMSNAGKQWMLDEIRRREEKLFQREERVITSLALSLLGGDETKLRRALNSPAFTYTARVGGAVTEGQFEVGGQEMDGKWQEGGVETRHWNRTAIREWLRVQLEEMRRDEIRRGVLTSENIDGSRNTVFDKLFYGKSGLMERFPEHAAMLRQVMLTGGAVHSGTAPSAFSPDALQMDGDKLDARYDADATSVLYALLGKIGNVTIVTGRADYSLRYGDEESRVPSLAFIPDRTNPMLVLPYGSITPTTEEATLAVESALEWLGEHGGVDFSEVVKPIIENFDLLNEPGLSGLRSGYRQALSNHLNVRGVQAMSEEDAAYLREDRSEARAREVLRKYGMEKTPENLLSPERFEAKIDEWTEAAISRVRELTAQGFDGLSDIIDPRFVEMLREADYVDDSMNEWTGGLREQGRRKVLARILTNPAAKELLIYTTFDSGAPVPSAAEQAAFGDLVGFHSVKGLDRQAMRDQALYFDSQGLTITDQRGQNVLAMRASDGGFGISDDQLGQLDELGNLIASEETDVEMPPIAPLQAEWANALLYQALRNTTPQNDPSAPLRGQKRNDRLTEYQARQLLAVMPVDEKGDPLELADIMSATGESARKLMDRFQRMSTTGVVPGSNRDRAASLDILKRYGTYSFHSALTGGSRRWEANRIQKGAILFAELAGVEFEQSPINNSRSATVVPDLQAMEATLREKELLKDITTTLDAAGRPLADGKTETVNVFEGLRRAVFAEDLANREFIRAESAKASELLARHDNLTRAIASTQQLLDDQYESIDAMLTWLDGQDDASKAAAEAIRRFVGSRRDVSRDFAEDMLSNFERAAELAGQADPLSPRAMSAIANSPMMDRLRSISEEYGARRLGMQTGVSERGDLTEESFWFGVRYADHNVQVVTLFKELHDLAPGNFSRSEGKQYRIEIGMPAREAERRISNLTGFIKRLGDERFIARRVMRSAERAVIGSPLNAASMGQRVTAFSGMEEYQAAEDRLAQGDSKISLSAAAQNRVLGALDAAKARIGQRLDTELRQRLLDRLSDIIHQDLFGRDEMAEGAKSAARVALDDLAGRALRGDIRHANDVLAVLTASGIDERADGLFPTERQEFATSVNPLARNAALAELLRGDLSALARKTESSIRRAIEALEQSKAKRPKFAGWRAEGYATLRLETGRIGEKKVDATDVEIARRALEAYGKMSVRNSDSWILPFSWTTRNSSSPSVMLTTAGKRIWRVPGSKVTLPMRRRPSSSRTTEGSTGSTAWSGAGNVAGSTGARPAGSAAAASPARVRTRWRMRVTTPEDRPENARVQQALSPDFSHPVRNPPGGPTASGRPPIGV